MAAVVYQLKSCKVNEISNHELIQAKARVNSSKSLKAVIWSSLQSHTDSDCDFVNVKDRSNPQNYVEKAKIAPYLVSTIILMKTQ